MTGDPSTDRGFKVAGADDDPGLSIARQRMVELQLVARGIRDPEVLRAMATVPRHRFVDGPEPYGDHPLPIGWGQTVSQPYMVARMTELCELGASDRVLEVGAGCGYQTAVLAGLCQHVFAVEIIKPLAETAAARLAELGCENVTVAHRDGTVGWPEHGPFDAILVAAGAPAVPAPLETQLADGGRLVLPVGDLVFQTLRRYLRQGEQLLRTDDTGCRFVQLRGEHGWQ